MSELRGAYTALITPFEADGRGLDLSALDRILEAQAAAGVRGVVPCGTTGETPTLTPEEQAEVIGRTVATARALGLEVIAGAGANDTATAIRNHRMAADLGVDAALHVAPYYNRPGQEGLTAHFTAIADSAELPVVLYDVPGRTGVRIEPATVVRLAAHPNIRGLKAAGGSLDDVSKILRGCDLAVLSGDDTLTLPMMSIGARGVISVLSNVMPAEVAGLCRAVESSRWLDARERHLALHPAADALLSLASNPVPIKAAMALAGWCDGSVRLPLTAAGPEVTAAVRSILVEAGFEPSPEAVEA